MEKTTIYLSADLQRRLKAAAQRHRRSQAELIREALERYLHDDPRPWPRSIGAGSDGGLLGSEAKAWVREQWAAKWDERDRPR